MVLVPLPCDQEREVERERGGGREKNQFTGHVQAFLSQSYSSWMATRHETPDGAASHWSISRKWYLFMGR